MAIPTRTLSDGIEVPAIGCGTFMMEDGEATAAVASAIDAGYRLIDTAVHYENEEAVGDAIQRSGISRDEIFVITKVPGRAHAFDQAIACAHESLARLGLEQLDMLLIHWPNPRLDLYVEAWRALIQLQSDGVVRSIGVANFCPEHLKRIIEETGVKPAINQIELHPYFNQEPMRTLHADLGIQTMAWAPIGKGLAFDEPVVAQVAVAHDVTPSQVILRWQLQLGTIPIPKSVNPERQRLNLDIFDFELTTNEMQAISKLGKSKRLFSPDPRDQVQM